MKIMSRQIFLIFLSLIVSQLVFANPGISGKATKRLYGKVVTSMDVNNYTYVQIDTGKKKYWAAGPKAEFKKGAMISFDSQMPFTDFQSKALNRTFDEIYFVSRFYSDKPDSKMDAPNPHAGMNKPLKPMAIKGIKKAPGGKSIAEVFKQKQSLQGKRVKIRAKVVKYTAQVMGKNWLHIQDSSGTKKLVVTTTQEVKKGDMVLISGIVAVDQDLGYGYTYEVIIEQASLSVE